MQKHRAKSLRIKLPNYQTIVEIKQANAQFRLAKYIPHKRIQRLSHLWSLMKYNPTNEMDW